MSPKSVPKSKNMIEIKPQRGLQFVDFKEILKYKEILYFYIIKDIKIRYKQTVLGGLWIMIQPLMAMVVFSLFFGKWGKIPSDGVPYPIFCFAALVPWNYFSKAVSNSATSLVSSSALISKVYFPRVIIPFSPIFAGLIDFVFAFLILLGMMVFFQVSPTIMIIFIPFLIVLMMAIAGGVGMILSALNAKYRDVAYIMTFLIQTWMFISPVIYPTSMMPERYHLIYALNPMTGIIEGFRSVLLGTIPFPYHLLLVSIIVSLILIVIGTVYFKKMEIYLTDVL